MTMLAGFDSRPGILGLWWGSHAISAALWRWSRELARLKRPAVVAGLLSAVAAED